MSTAQCDEKNGITLLICFVRITKYLTGSMRTGISLIAARKSPVGKVGLRIRLERFNPREGKNKTYNKYARKYCPFISREA